MFCIRTCNLWAKRNNCERKWVCPKKIFTQDPFTRNWAFSAFLRNVQLKHDLWKLGIITAWKFSSILTYFDVIGNAICKAIFMTLRNPSFHKNLYWLLGLIGIYNMLPPFIVETSSSVSVFQSHLQSLTIDFIKN